LLFSPPPFGNQSSIHPYCMGPPCTFMCLPPNNLPRPSSSFPLDCFFAQFTVNFTPTNSPPPSISQIFSPLLTGH
jgi:hypothetical protein